MNREIQDLINKLGIKSPSAIHELQSLWDDTEKTGKRHTPCYVDANNGTINQIRIERINGKVKLHCQRPALHRDDEKTLVDFLFKERIVGEPEIMDLIGLVRALRQGKATAFVLLPAGPWGAPKRMELQEGRLVFSVETLGGLVDENGLPAIPGRN